jgi:2-polyprenyl-6-methoxyphenol hydroxylase-like FAD-dependent oxidoreductase
LVLALELAVWVVYVLLVKRHRLALPFPRGRAISIRSVEILRQLGLEQEVTQTSSPRSETVHFFAGASLTAPEFGRVGSTPAQGEKAVSPTAALGCPQDRSRRCCVSGSSTIRWSTRGSEPCCVDAQQRVDHVEVRLRPSGGPDSTVRTSWLVGADGSRSRVHHLVGIGTDTLGVPCSNVNILIDADLGRRDPTGW